ncbi:ATP-grasp domain-containing protein [Sphingobium sp. Cam5-1]|uniref:ATP-grasp domain-containing protein n=1 Tax=Sphingobium sp. Cam5-1 TaxID=2789327 RepID=UPI0018AD2900|nr:ATP-grasp domain-containing protein [Sphingobium sp. Cam5-1]QPI71972.1 ATP-grasp domain-containing protein [Sphingobium sp. Cam5-1]
MPTLILLAHVPTDAVNEGFLPAARRLGLEVTLLTDQAEAHHRHFAAADRPAYPDKIVECDVFNPVAVINEISRCTERPAAIFSNSDHLQTSAALAADYFGLPGKDWKTTYRAKNKAAMRCHLRDLGIDTLWHAVVTDEDGLAALCGVPFPCVAKPREGVGSQLVRFCEEKAALVAHCRQVWRADPGRAVLIEDYMAGELYTLETLGDGKDIAVLGGFHVALSPPPDFVEIEGRWGSWLTAEQKDAVLGQIQAVGVGFGSCHTEFVMTPKGPRIVEINYRTVGDHMEFMLEHTLDMALFEKILRLHLGEPLGQCSLAARVAAIRYFPADEAGEIVSAPEAFLRTHGGLRVEYRSLRRPGERVAITHSNKDYLGVLSASAPDRATLDAAMAEARAALSWEIRP